MEKFRVQIETVKKYHFWILFGLIVLSSLGVWWMATADASTRYDSGKKKKADVENKVKVIINNSKHPNDATIAEFEALIGKVSKTKNPGSLSNQVFAAWIDLYTSMRKNNQLPDIFNSRIPTGSVPDKRLQKEFETQFDSLWRPMEEIPSVPREQDFSDKDREQYQNHVREFFPKLLGIVEWRHADTNQTPGEERRPSGPNMRRSMPGLSTEETKKMIGIVDWADAEKAMGRFQQWTGSPSTLQIMTAQEDLWVYESMLKVIRNTNNLSNLFYEDNDHPYVSPGTHKAARVKRIDAMEIGQDAVANWLKADQSVIRLATDANAAAAPGAAPAAPPKLDNRGGGYSGGGNTTGVSLLANRYVDENGKPLEDPTKQPFAEFRMMPIFMRVVIEQSAVSRLLAACANSSMRIDVTAVRLLTTQPPPYEPAAPDAGATPGTPGNAPAPGRSSGPVVESRPMVGSGRHGGGFLPGGRGGSGMFGGDGGATADEDDALNATFPTVVLEIHGIVYIYNKPKFSQMGKGNASGGTGDAATAPGAESNDPDAEPSAETPDANAPAGNAAPPADTTKAMNAVPPAGAAPAPATNGAAPGTASPAASQSPPAAATGGTATLPTPANATPAVPIPAASTGGPTMKGK